MTNDELLDTIERAKAGDTTARNAIIQEALPTVNGLARAMAARVKFRLEPEEFVSVAALSFDQIIRAFDPARGHSLLYLCRLSPAGRDARSSAGT